MGTDNSNRVNGSPLGVRTATTATIPTMAYRRTLRNDPGVKMPRTCRRIRRSGNWKPIPKAKVIFTTNPRYRAGEKTLTRSGPPIPTRKSKARGILQ